MGRPVEYTPARRMAMQVVLAFVLGISVLLAWLLSRAHAARVYPRKWEVHQVGNFSIEVPAGWSASVVRGRFGRYIEAAEGAGEKHNGRQIRVIDQPIEDENQASSLDVAMAFLNQKFSADDFQPLDILGHKGVWIEVPTEMSAEGPRLGFLAAFVLLPSNRVILVRMTGPAIFVPGDIELFKRVAQSLKESRGKGQTVLRPSRRALAYLSSGSTEPCKGHWAGCGKILHFWVATPLKRPVWSI